jgi:hypothetical protein
MISLIRAAADSVNLTGFGRSRRGFGALYPSEHVQFQFGFFAHPLRRQGGIGSHIDRDLADAIHQFSAALTLPGISCTPGN